MVLPGADGSGRDERGDALLHLPVRGLTFAAPGVYVIEALADGVVLARRELRVIAKVPAAVSVAALAPSAS